MTNFLTRLAERTLGLATVAQPVIAPLFAPAPGQIRDTSFHIQLGDDVSSSSWQDTSTQEWLQDAFDVEPPISPLAAQRPLAGASQPASVERRMLPGHSGNVEGDTSIRQGIDVAEAMPQMYLHTEVPVQRVGRDAQQEELLVTRYVIRNGSERSHSQENVLAPPHPTQYQRENGQQPLERTFAEHPSPTDVFPAAQQSVHLMSERQSAPPIVRVTIGRIEVRAMMQPKEPVAPVKRPRPTLSLDDYLKHGGQR